MSESTPVPAAPSAPKAKRGRRPIHFPIAKIEAFCQIQATDEEIAAHFGCSVKTIHRIKKRPMYRDAFSKGRADGLISLRRAQYQEALKGSPSMLIWLGKQMLGQREKFQHTGPNDGPVKIEAVRSMLDNLSEDDFIRLARENGVDLQGQLPAACSVIDVTPSVPAVVAGDASSSDLPQPAPALLPPPGEFPRPADTP